MSDLRRDPKNALPSDLHYGPLESANEEEALGVTLSECFGMKASYWPKYVEAVGRPNIRRVTRNGAIIAGCCAYRMGHFFGGQSVPAGGVAAVGVPPEERGSGVAFLMMSRMLRDLRAEGIPLASLFASTQRLYRKVGYEQAGTMTEFTMPTHAIGELPRELPVRRVSALQVAHFRDLHLRRARRCPGFVDRPEGMWTRLLSAWGDTPERVAFLIGPEQAPEGYLVFSADTSGEEDEVTVRDLVAMTPAALKTLWSLIADHRSVLRRVRWRGSLNDPSLALFPEQRYKVASVERWMLRIVDVEKALLARGYDPHVSASLTLEVSDDIVPENAGRYGLVLERGTLTVTRVAGGLKEVRGAAGAALHVRALAPLYSGFFSATELVNLGWMEGDAAAIAAADAIFRGPSPWLVDSY